MPMSETATLHGGCYACQSTDAPVLLSIPTPSALAAKAKGLYSIAVCPPCAAHFQKD